jgi:hypothetical protein
MKSVYRTPFAYFDLVETFPKPGCAVCSLAQRDVQQYIDNMLFEFANEPGLRALFSAGRGVCIEHGLMLKNNKIGNVIGIARMYRETLDDILAILDGAPVKTVEPPRLQRLLGAPARADGGSLADQLEPSARCIACERLEEFEAVYIDMFNRYLNDERFLSAFRASQGLCLPHFRQALRRVESPEMVQVLAGIQRDIWSSLRDEVHLFLEKQNYEHIGDPVGDEGDSWVRAILRMAGERGVFGLRRDKG